MPQPTCETDGPRRSALTAFQTIESGDGENQDALGEARQRLHLAVPVRMGAIRRALRVADRRPRQHRDEQIHAGMRRLGEDADRAAGDADDQFPDDEQPIRDDSEECHAIEVACAIIHTDIH